MSAYVTGDGWTPAVTLDLESAGSAAFENAKQAFNDWSKGQPPLGPVMLPNGWHDITPQISEDLLRRNTGNRRAGLATVKKYGRAMKKGEWAPTGQPILINSKGKLEDAAHRLWAGYFTKTTFRSYVISDVPFIEDLFAFIDDSKPRSAADALYTSGGNGLSATLASAIKLAGRYDDGSLDAFRQFRGVDFSVREVLAYSRLHPTLAEVAHLVTSAYPTAIEIIGSKPVAVFFAWRAHEAHGATVLEDFLTALASDDGESDSPTEGYRARLLREEKMGNDLRAPHRLALLIKAFNLYVAGKRIGKKGLYLLDSEPFPQIEAPEAMPAAAE